MDAGLLVKYFGDLYERPSIYSTPPEMTTVLRGHRAKTAYLASRQDDLQRFTPVSYSADCGVTYVTPRFGQGVRVSSSLGLRAQGSLVLEDSSRELDSTYNTSAIFKISTSYCRTRCESLGKPDAVGIENTSCVERLRKLLQHGRTNFVAHLGHSFLETLNADPFEFVLTFASSLKRYNLATSH